jgi:4-hydroxy-3-methylbut-2-enyl diphosphate reductase
VAVAGLRECTPFFNVYKVLITNYASCYAMRILLANPRGFCAGVNMALQSLQAAVVKFDAQAVYVYHEIVHNSNVVRHYADLGVRFVQSLDEVSELSVLMFSAHGVSPEVRREAERKSLHIIDATCPLVSQVHRAVKRYANQGFHVIYIGHPGHDEVVGTVGEAPGQITVISTESDVQTLFENRSQKYSERKLACLMQTTLSVTETQRIVGTLQKHFPGIEVPGKGICYATQNRQEAVRQLAQQADFALVIGSANSSNSRRLREIAEQQGITARLIDGAEEIDLHWFTGHETLLITAGASAPEHIVQACVQRLRDAFDVDFGVDVEEVVTCEEHVVFPLPTGVRYTPNRR